MTEVGTGVRQGGALSPLFFILDTNKFLAELRARFEGTTECFSYANDVAHVTNTKEGVLQIMQRWNELLKSGIKLRYLKNKYMVVKKEQEQGVS